jgi:hypothetical protein
VTSRAGVPAAEINSNPPKIRNRIAYFAGFEADPCAIRVDLALI